MNRTLLGGFVLLLSTMQMLSAVNAQPLSQSVAERTVIGEPITPVNLVYTAYRGQFEREGIPKFNRFVTQYQSRQLTAEDLVRAAIQARRLPGNALSDRHYISNVELYLGFLSRFNH